MHAAVIAEWWISILTFFIVTVLTLCSSNSQIWGKGTSWSGRYFSLRCLHTLLSVGVKRRDSLKQSRRSCCSTGNAFSWSSAWSSRAPAGMRIVASPRSPEEWKDRWDNTLFRKELSKSSHADSFVVSVPKTFHFKHPRWIHSNGLGLFLIMKSSQVPIPSCIE